MQRRRGDNAPRPSNPLLRSCAEHAIGSAMHAMHASCDPPHAAMPPRVIPSLCGVLQACPPHVNHALRASKHALPKVVTSTGHGHGRLKPLSIRRKSASSTVSDLWSLPLCTVLYWVWSLLSGCISLEWRRNDRWPRVWKRYTAGSSPRLAEVRRFFNIAHGWPLTRPNGYILFI